MATTSDPGHGTPMATRATNQAAVPQTTPATDAGVATTPAARVDVFNSPNVYSAQLANACQAGDATITVVSAAPTSLQSASFSAQIDSEVIAVTSGQNTLTWNVTRAQESTTAAAHAAGTLVAYRVPITFSNGLFPIAPVTS